MLFDPMMAMRARLARLLHGLRLAVSGRDCVEDIETDLFNELVRLHVSEGWRKTYEYDGIDAWIDYGRVVLEKGPHRLVFVWDNWSEGEITGPTALVRDLARRHDRRTVRGTRDLEVRR